MKWCCILLFFLLCLLIFAAISTLFEKIFFDDDGPVPESEYPKRSDNDTFPSNKELIDNVCSAGTFELDRGVRCREYCEPMYTSCCDPFPKYETYDFTSVYDALNSTMPPSADVFDDNDFLHLNNCEYGEHLRGCTTYGKCSALRDKLDSAPGTLPYMCSEEGLAQDPGSCAAVCQKVACCFDETGSSCLAGNMDICMDYAPCQNLRTRHDPSQLVPVAPDDLDRVCLWKLPLCYEYCEKARCCTDTNSRCFQENFMSCLTYAPCEDGSDINITIPRIYNDDLPQAPAELMYACGEKKPENAEVSELIQPDTCPEYCEQAACCYQPTPAYNCFHKDPLGCLAWHDYCQTVPFVLESWYIGEFILPTPP